MKSHDVETGDDAEDKIQYQIPEMKMDKSRKGDENL